LEKSKATGLHDGTRLVRTERLETLEKQVEGRAADLKRTFRHASRARQRTPTRDLDWAPERIKSALDAPLAGAAASIVARGTRPETALMHHIHTGAEDAPGVFPDQSLDACRLIAKKRLRRVHSMQCNHPLVGRETHCGKITLKPSGKGRFSRPHNTVQEMERRRRH